MAITPRTIFSSAAPATVAAVSLLAFTAVGTVAYMSAQECSSSKTAPDRPASAAAAGCDDLREAIGADQSDWSERDWIHYAKCFDRRHNSRAAAHAAASGLKYYPNSASLYNIKGLHEILLERHSTAVHTLREGVESTRTPYTGVLENNLAWAGLWVPREMSLEEARGHYRAALDKEPNVCAYLHTGLWVEYAIGQKASGVERFEALREFDDLRSRYASCLDRLNSADWKTVAEIGGAAVMYDELAEGQSGLATDDASKTSGEELLRDVARTLDDEYSGASIDDLCRDAMPVPSTHQTCVEKFEETRAELTAEEVETRDTEPAAAGGGGGGGPCPAMVQ